MTWLANAVLISPDEGHYDGARFQFSIKILGDYPHSAPKVHCDTKASLASGCSRSADSHAHRSASTTLRRAAIHGTRRQPECTPGCPQSVPPAVRACVSLTRARLQVYHPNIDLEGNVCLNILREEWKPILNVNAVIFGLQFLFLEPNPSDPLNKCE